jgi:hypothetical protein
VADVAPAGTAECAGMAQGLLLQALAPAVREQYAAAGGCPEALERLLQARFVCVVVCVWGGGGGGATS